MSVTIMIQCHKSPEQIQRMVNALNHPDIFIVIHIDRKTNRQQWNIRGDRVFIIPQNKSVDVRWSDYSQIEATLLLMKYAIDLAKTDYYWLCSGSDFPIASATEIADFFKVEKCDYINILPSCKRLEPNPFDKRNDLYYPRWMYSRSLPTRILKQLYILLTGGRNKTIGFFKRSSPHHLRYYYGSQWLCLRRETLCWILDYLDKQPEFMLFWHHAMCPDESFFQTLYMSSPFADQQEDYLHYVDWSEKKASPKTLTIDDYPKLLSSNKLMARKIDLNIDGSIVDALEKNSGQPAAKRHHERKRD